MTHNLHAEERIVPRYVFLTNCVSAL